MPRQKNLRSSKHVYYSHLEKRFQLVNDPLLKKFKQLQSSTPLLISQRAFNRLIQGILHSHDADFKIQRLAVEGLQEAAEVYLTTMFCAARRLSKKCTKGDHPPQGRRSLLTTVREESS